MFARMPLHATQSKHFQGLLQPLARVPTYHLHGVASGSTAQAGVSCHTKDTDNSTPPMDLWRLQKSSMGK